MYAKIIAAIKEEFGGEIMSACTVRFSAFGEEFCFTRGTIYLQVDDRFAGVGSKVKTIAAVKKFVEARI
jgi:hypothetical protein